jgi:hypothetical protein
MKQAAIASVIERDLLRADDAKPRTDISKCFVCGYSMVYRGKRFCSDRCRDFYDAGNAGQEQDWLRPPDCEDVPLGDLRVIAGPPSVEIGSRYYVGVFGREPMLLQQRTRNGYIIRCAGCHKEFDSKGLRCCSIECERRYRERQDNLAVMAEAGVEPAAKRECETCGAVIPKWRNGRKVSAATRFCSPKCSRKAPKPNLPEMTS